MKDLLKILQQKEEPIENQQIIDYLKGTLEAAAQHQVEENEQEDVLMQDAMEGLRMMEDKGRLEKVTKDLNNQLQQRIAEQKTKRNKQTRWENQDWVIMAVITILLLLIICYVVINWLNHN